MDIVRGMIVCSKAGKDKGDFSVVTDFDDKYAYICDGKLKPLDKAKKKNRKHVSITKTVLSEEQISTNKQIRKSLRIFKDKSDNTDDFPNGERGD